MQWNRSERTALPVPQWRGGIARRAQDHEEGKGYPGASDERRTIARVEGTIAGIVANVQRLPTRKMVTTAEIDGVGVLGVGEALATTALRRRVEEGGCRMVQRLPRDHRRRDAAGDGVVETSDRGERGPGAALKCKAVDEGRGERKGRP